MPPYLLPLTDSLLPTYPNVRPSPLPVVLYLYTATAHVIADNFQLAIYLITKYMLDHSSKSFLPSTLTIVLHPPQRERTHNIACFNFQASPKSTSCDLQLIFRIQNLCSLYQ